MEQIQIQDGSNDKGYFTIVPNYILNHSTATAQALYLQLKRLAGEKGIAYPSRQFLMDKLGISKPTLLKEFSYLLNKKWIEFVGEVDVETSGGTQKTKGYRIIDLWKINADFYTKGVKNNTPLEPKGVKNTTAKGVKQGGKKYTHKEEPLEEEPLQQERFDVFWNSYPKKQSKKIAEKSWNKLNPSTDLFKKIISSLEVHKKTEQWTKENGRFIPYPATWINQERWNDEIKTKSWNEK